MASLNTGPMSGRMAGRFATVLVDLGLPMHYWAFSTLEEARTFHGLFSCFALNLTSKDGDTWRAYAKAHAVDEA
jgi:uncharacterized membrane protein